MQYVRTERRSSSALNAALMIRNNNMQFAEFLGTWTAGSGKLAVSASAFGTGGNGLCVMLTGWLIMSMTMQISEQG
jgi:hypothetical protein